ncbi:hypothetical protein [Marivivens marinus]|uniref:hypothetical protein n=1 Tax=Marivivens marinus TaxID=3110173 RepID=UPI003B846474
MTIRAIFKNSQKVFLRRLAPHPLPESAIKVLLKLPTGSAGFTPHRISAERKMAEKAYAKQKAAEKMA